MNISSIVVKTKPECFENVKYMIENIQNCEVYLSDEKSSQIIVVLEVDSTEQEVAINNALEQLEGVVNANMHYTYQEDELNAQIRQIDGSLPEFLNNDEVPLDSISYNGSVANLMGKKRLKK